MSVLTVAEQEELARLCRKLGLGAVPVETACGGNRAAADAQCSEIGAALV